MASNIQFKRGTAAALYAANPVLLRGEPGLEIDTNKIKYGNGVTPWRDLPYGNPALEVVDGGALFAPAVPAVPGIFTPPTLDGLVLWLDANDPDYTHKVNNRLSMWEDLSETRAQFFQSNKANRPSVVNQIAEEDVVTFDGTSDAMLGNFTLPAEFTLLVALRRRGNSTNGKLITAYSANGASELVLCGTATGNSVGVSSGEDYLATQPVDDLVPVIYTLQFSADGLSTRLNGLNTQADTASIEAAKTIMSLGGDRADFSADNFSGDVAEIVMYDRILPAADLLDAETYMMERWGIVQVSHPLLEGMKAFWPLNEESGSRVDITDAEVTLTQTGTVDFEPGVIGNAANFTGGANYLTAPTDFTLAGSFSVSVWFKPAAVTGSTPQIIQNWAGGMQGQLVLGFGDEGSETGVIWGYVRTADDNYRVSAPDLEANRWYHVAMVFNQTNNKLLLYVDGALVDQITTAGALMTTSIPLRVGVGEQTSAPNTVAFLADQLGIWDRALSAADVEMLYNDELGKEDFTADLYGDNVSLLLHMDKPANAVGGPGGGTGSSDPYFSDVALLLHFNGTDGSTTFVDNSYLQHTVTAEGNAVISTAQSKFGAAGAFDGASFLSLPAVPPLDISTGDFTIEAWVFLNSMPTTDDLYNWQSWMVVYERGTPNAADGWQFQIGQTKLMFSNGYGVEVCSGDHGMVANQWYHVSVTRSGSTFRVFVDGVQVGTSNGSLTLFDGTTYYIGCETGEGAYLDGYIDDLRVVSGLAVYTENFSAPTAEFPLGSIKTVTMPTVETALLLHMDGASFVDSGDNGLTVTANGATLSTAQSKFGGSSAYFDGTADLQFTPSVLTQFGGDDFTVEFWLYITDEPQDNQVIISFCNWPNTSGIVFGYTSTLFTAYTGGFASVYSVLRPANNAWHHYAAVRINGQLSLFIDGIKQTPVAAPGSFSGNFTDGLQYIGRPTDANSFQLHGYLDELRITKGAGLYGADFTPPTAPFADPQPTPDLLITFDDGIVDLSPSARPITNNNGVTAELPTPAAAGFENAGVFNGTNSHLVIPDAPAFDLSSGPFCVELRFIVTAPGQDINVDAQVLIAKDQYGVSYSWGISIAAEAIRVATANIAGDWEFLVSQIISSNEWHHIALTGDGTTMKLFYDGALVGTKNRTLTNAPADVTIGCGSYNNPQGHFPGYIDNVRIVKGAQVYTENFTPPAASLTAPAVTPVPDLLLHFDGANGSTTFTDHGKKQLTVTATDATISTAQSKFGGASGYFDGDGDFLAVTGLALLSEDFTVECWVRLNEIKECAIFNQGNSDVTGNFCLAVSPVDGSLFLYADNNGRMQSMTSLTVNQWHHVALTRSGNDYRLFIDGVSEATHTGNYSHDGLPFKVAHGYGGISFLNGYIDDLRVIKGTAIYTANFTPPVAPFQNPIITITQPSAGLTNGLEAFWKFDDLTDSSGNSHTLSDAGYVTFVPGKLGQAAYFDGSPQSLTLSGLRVATSAGYTLNAWVKHAANSPALPFFFQAEPFTWGWTPVVAMGFHYAVVGSNDGGGPKANTYDVAPITSVDGEWHMYTAAYDGLTLKFYIDGQLHAEAQFDGAANGIDDWVLRDIAIGSGMQENYCEKWVDAFGIWSRALAVNEISALYNNGNGTETLTGGGGGGTAGPITTFIDSSKHNHELTAVGSAYLNLTDIKYGSGSGEFAGGHCTIPMSPEFALGADDFTVEFWGKLNYAANSAVFSIAPESEEAGTYLIGFRNDPNMFGFCYDMPNFTFVSADISAQYGEWAHYAFVRLAGVLKMYVNGTQVGAANTTINLDGGTQATAVVGRRWVDVDDYYLDGLIDDLRITKGVARYISNFNPPTKAFPDPVLTAPPPVAGDPYAENVTLLLHMDGANGSTTFTDNSYLQNTVTAEGGAVVSTDQSKFGGASFYGNAGHYLKTDPAVGDFDSADFTAETWIFAQQLQPGFPTIFSNYETWGGGTYGLFCGMEAVPDKWCFGNDGVYPPDIISQSNLQYNQWVHLAVVRRNDVLTLYVNGVAEATKNVNGVSYSGNGSNFWVGAAGDNPTGTNFNGYIDDLRITKGVARYTADFIPPEEPFPNPFTPGVDATLLMHFDGANESSNLVDSSVNGFDVISGGAVISTAQSKFGGASGDFSGGGATITSTPAFEFSGDFAVEGWFFFNNNNVGYQPLISAYAAGDATGWVLTLETNNTLNFYGSTGNYFWSLFCLSNYVPASGQWVHVAVTREGSTVRMFADGVQVGTTTSSINVAGGTTVGVGYYQYFPDFPRSLNGYIDELRIVNGAAVYVADFTPPTAPFSPTAAVTPGDITGCDLWLDSTGDIAVSNGAILTWADKSGNGRTATPADYAPAPVVAAGEGPNGQDVVRFSGDPNVLDVSYQFNLKNSSGFILLGQTAQSLVSGWQRILGFQPSTGIDSQTTDGMCVVVNNYMEPYGLALFNDNTQQIDAPVTLPLAWTLIAYTVSASGEIKFRVNGVEVDSSTAATMANKAGGNLYIGHGGALYTDESLQGDIAEISLFDHALGEAALIGLERGILSRWLPPPAPPGVGETALLLHFDGSNGSTTFTDSSSHNLTATANGDAAISTAESKFGGAAAYFDGDGDYISVEEDAGMNFGTGDWTVEFFVKGGPQSLAFPCIIGVAAAWSPGVVSIAFDHGWSDGTLVLTAHSHASGSPVLASGAIDDDEWHHCAIVRNGNSCYLYIDGLLADSTTVDSSLEFDFSAGDTRIGGGNGDGADSYFNGYIDELRVVKGAAVYTGNFTPPTRPFGASDLLLHFDSDTSDNSGNSVSVTNNGVTIDTMTKQFGSGSAYFNGASVTTLTTPDLPAFGFGTGDFTIEMFVKQQNAARNSVLSIGTYQDGILWRLSPAITDSLYLAVNDPAGGAWDWDATASVPVDVWAHIALTRQNGTVRAFIDGVKVFEQFNVTADLGASRPLTIGCGAHELEPTDAYYGFIDELRIIKGEAVYTNNFTPPTAPFN